MRALLLGIFMFFTGSWINASSSSDVSSTVTPDLTKTIISSIYSLAQGMKESVARPTPTLPDLLSGLSPAQLQAYSDELRFITSKMSAEEQYGLYLGMAINSLLWTRVAVFLYHEFIAMRHTPFLEKHIAVYGSGFAGLMALIQPLVLVYTWISAGILKEQWELNRVVPRLLEKLEKGYRASYIDTGVHGFLSHPLYKGAIEEFSSALADLRQKVSLMASSEKIAFLLGTIISSMLWLWGISSADNADNIIQLEGGLRVMFSMLLLLLFQT